MNWLITGGCGYLGTRLIERLVGLGETVRVIDNLSVGRLSDLGAVCQYQQCDSDAAVTLPQVGFVQLYIGDVLDQALPQNLCQDIDVIVHFAGNTGVDVSLKNPRIDCHANVLGTFNMLEAARVCGVGRFIMASSGAVIGDAPPPVDEAVMPRPRSPYGASKLAAEGYCSAYWQCYGVETVVLRFSNVYGPGFLLKNSLVARFIKQAVNGETLTIYGDGAQTRDFIYNEDLVDAILCAANTKNIAGRIFHVSTGIETSVLDLTRLLSQVMVDQGIGTLSWVHADARQGEALRSCLDNSEAKKYLGWSCQTDLKDGLRQTIDWFLEMSPV